MKHVSINEDLMQAFVIINNAGMMINACVNVNNRLIKEFAIKELFETLVIERVNMINHTKWVSIYPRKIVSAEKH